MATSLFDFCSDQC